MHCYLMFLTVLLKLTQQETVHPEFRIKFEQNDYNATAYRVEVIRYNKIYINSLDIKTFKYNRTCTAFNASGNLNCDVSKIEIVVQVYKFTSNEYRLFPIRFEYNLCKAVAQNAAGIGTILCGNVKDCTVTKGRTYYICNWTMDPKKLPPYIPSGRFMTEYQAFYGSTEIAFVRGYIDITRPEARK